MTHRSSPRPLALAVDRLTESLAPATALARIQGAWEGVVGEAIAAAARPTGERAGVVVVTCSAAVWAQELDLMAPRIVAGLNEALGGELVSDLRCRTG